MKKALKKLVKEEGGQVFLLTLALLIVGGLVLTPLLNYMSTGLNAGSLFKEATDELYAADAGVEDAIWQIQQGENSTIVDTTTAEAYGVTFYGLPPYSVDHDGDPETPDITSTSGTYSIADVNGKTVEITLQYIDGTVWQVFSTATSSNGSSTTVEVLTNDITGDYTGILNNVITSPNGYTVQGGQSDIDPPEGEEHGPDGDYDGDWPTPEELAAFYWNDVKTSTPYEYDSLDVKDYYTTGIGPLYRDGTLSISNSGAAGLTLTLNDTVYITGDTLIGMTDKDFYLDLNGNTIFVESATAENQYALKVGGKCTIKGSGAIIAVGNIEFKPNLDTGPENYLLVLSIMGKTYMQPNGDFYGTLAGNSEVHIQNGDATWTDPTTAGGDGDLNIPGMTTGVFWGILTWKVN